MKRNTTIISVILGILLFSSQAFAASTSWSYSDYSHGSYVPKSGDMFYYNYFNNNRNRYILETDVYFDLDQTNVTNILDYNNGGDNPGTVADNKYCFLTLDQTAKPQNIADIEINGYQVVTNLPDPKIDLEINYVGVDVDETEVVALGAVNSTTNYYMWSWWDDFRDGGTYDGGQFLAQFAMSEKGVSDYNNVVQSNVVQATMSYGDNYGQP